MMPAISWAHSIGDACNRKCGAGTCRSVRSLNSIAIFSIGSNGALTFVDAAWTRGSYPRSFNIEPSGQLLCCCNQRADNVAVFRVDRKTGGPNFTGHHAPVGNPSVIVFLDLAKTG
jgi:6-phosphogluconolactonase